MNTDGKFLHFLKEFPSQFILSTLLLIVLFVYVNYQIQFLERIIDLLAGGLLTTLIGGRKTPTVNADNVENVDNTNGTVTTNSIEPKKEENL